MQTASKRASTQHLSHKYNIKTMKKLLLTIPIWLLLHYSALCQLQGIGVSGGGNFANLKNPDASSTYDSQSNLGLGGGLRFDYRMADEYVMFSPEVFILQKGSEEFVSNISELNLGQVDISYIGMNLPLMIYGPMDEASEYSYNGIILQGKFYFDYFLSGSQKKEGISKELTFSSNGDKFEYGYALEAGFVVEGFQFSVGYNKGLKNFELEDTFANSETLFSVTNNGLFVSLGFVTKLHDD